MPDLSLAGLGVPVFLVGAVIVITMATLLLHLLFPAAKKRPARRVVLSKMARLCPVCQRKLTEAERSGVRIEVCPDCQGIWLSQGKLEQITR